MKIRVIARIDVKNEYVIKGIHLEGLRKIGNPNAIAKKYYNDGIDEILFMDVVASLYGRNNLFHIINQACKDVFIPITVGGGIRTIRDIELALNSGADKIAVNSQAVVNPEFIREAVNTYGSQCIVASVEAKRIGNTWEAYYNNGRDRSGIGVYEWVKKLQDLGAGEILLTSIDHEGTKKDFDLELIKSVEKEIKVPLIICGGAGDARHFSALRDVPGINAVAIASVLHYNILSVSEIKNLISTPLSDKKNE